MLIQDQERQDLSAVHALSSPKFTDEISQMGYICHTIIPEQDKFTQENRMGMISTPLSIAVQVISGFSFRC